MIKWREKKSSGTHQLPQLCSTQVDFPALCSAGDSSLIGHVLQRALLLLCSDPETEPFTLSALHATPTLTLTCDRRLTFDPDVAVPLEVVVGGLPGVAVVAQEGDGWAGPDGNVAHSFLVCRTRRKKEEGGGVNNGDGVEGGRESLRSDTHPRIPWAEIPDAPSAR